MSLVQDLHPKKTDQRSTLFVVKVVNKKDALMAHLDNYQETNKCAITWETDTRIIHIGETVVLTCTVHGIEEIDTGETRQWFKDSSLVCYNGKPTNSLKYKELLIRNKFQLLIYNITEDDLNCEYQCLYSFQTCTKKLEITTKNFEYPPTENTTELDYNYTMNGSFSVKLHLKKVFPRPNCTVSFQALQHTFAERMYKKIGLYFEVHLLHMSNVILDAITTFNVTCLLQKEHLIAEGEIGFDKGDQYVIDLDESSTLPDSGESSTTLPDLDENESWVLPVVITLPVLSILAIMLEEDGLIDKEQLSFRSLQKRVSEADCLETNT
ncbi:uncharacterized protein LOC143059444 [Mytilus galloprovincialis]|uniref:uncharacterized protein LOC143059444 n=1 Tax=Mytilus galloprovincialis TaxID=29158 RepID=UPI003F7C22BC